MPKLAVLLVLALLAGCRPASPPTIDDYRALGELRVAIREDRIDFFDDPDSQSSAGFEHDLLVALGSDLGVPVRFETFVNASEVLAAVRDGRAHVGAAGMSMREAPVTWSHVVREARYVVVRRDDDRSVRNENDLDYRALTVRRGSPAMDELRALKLRYSGMKLLTASAAGDYDLLRRLSLDQLDLVVTDRLHFDLARRFFPNLRVAVELPITASIVWALAETEQGNLHTAVNGFIERARRDALIEQTAEQYIGHLQRLQAVDISAFMERMSSRLPRFIDLFQQAGEAHGLDWRLLAAVSYQESQWDPDAVSYTGVRGLMMLTEQTARHLGIRDRTDPAQSITGGARYLSMLHDELPEDIPEPDRTWMTIAAYNLGMGHLRGARQIADQYGIDNTSWLGMKSFLPKLSKPAVARRLKGGPARGGEALVMTERVRNFYDVLREQMPEGPRPTDTESSPEAQADYPPEPTTAISSPVATQ